MRRAVLLLFALSMFGCSTNLYVRDVDSNPVPDAKVILTRYSLSGRDLGSTDAAGRIKIPWGLPDIEYITVSKHELVGTLYGAADLNHKPYIVVLNPRSEEMSPLFIKDAEFHASNSEDGGAVIIHTE